MFPPVGMSSIFLVVISMSVLRSVVISFPCPVVDFPDALLLINLPVANCLSSQRPFLSV